MVRIAIVKHCPRCSRGYTLEEFLALRSANGGGEIEGNFGGTLHVRNCACGNTYGVEVLPCGRVVTDDEQRSGVLLDPRKHRVSIVCACRNDLTFGYGKTREEAHHEAMLAFKRHNGRAKVLEVISEVVHTSPLGHEYYAEETP